MKKYLAMLDLKQKLEAAKAPLLLSVSECKALAKMMGDIMEEVEGGRGEGHKFKKKKHKNKIIDLEDILYEHN